MVGNIRCLIIGIITVWVLNCKDHSQDFIRFTYEFCKELNDNRYLGLLVVVRFNESTEEDPRHFIVDTKYLYFDYLKYYELEYPNFTNFLFEKLNSGYDKAICEKDNYLCIGTITHLCMDPVPLRASSRIEYALSHQLLRNKKTDILENRDLEEEELMCLVKTMFFNEYLVRLNEDTGRYNFIAFTK